MRGVSVFLGQRSKEQIEHYLTLMQNYGFHSIFTSLHIPEDDPSMYVEELRQLGECAYERNMQLIADISPSSLAHLGCSFDSIEQLTIKGLTGLRVDYGIEPQTIATLSKKMGVALNASTLTDSFFRELMGCGLDPTNVSAWHNYYPRPETGLEKRDFIEKNKQLQAYGIKVAAFVPGEGEKRGPFQKGLPTLEKHREVSPFAAAVELWRECGVDQVMIGDPFLFEESAQAFAEYDQGIITLKATIGTVSESIKALIDQIHYERLDCARDVVRSSSSRKYAQIGELHVPIGQTMARPRGTITIDNHLYGRYQGELQITKRTLEAHDSVNVLGHIVKEDHLLLDLVGPGDRFRLKRG